jgi:hypothetical protein
MKNKTAAHPKNEIREDPETADDFMIQMTKADFDVELLATSGEAALFGALRKGGNQHISTPNGPWQSHVMGGWHFVVVTPSGGSVRMFQTQQWHIPRFQMADALLHQDRFFSSREYEDPTSATWMPIPTLIHGRHKLSFVIDGSGEFRLPEPFVEEMKKDLPIVERAKERVKEKGEEYHIPRVKTAAGHSVESRSSKLLEAIAFEKLTVPRMTAGNFGIYSAYCTYRDFDTSIEMETPLVRDLLEAQFEDTAKGISEDRHMMFCDVQKKLLTKSIWGNGVQMKLDEAVPIMAAGMAKLTRAQRTQFILMNGMHGAGLFLPLAAVLGLCSFEQYADYMCQGMAPDSPQEQERRIETAYVKLFGQLASN